MSVDNPIQLDTELSTSVRRLGREKLAERTIGTVVQLTSDTETVAAAFRAAGLRFSRKAEVVKRETLFPLKIMESCFSDPWEPEETMP